ncbi:hypothetical protein [Stenotrophomonas sp. GZD-301]|uniref:hypothetical protein n=1 Tax=Stenotrophomonas sp. GZD-301 TaxID=3404814 RepID=UPI003BB6D8EC
MSRNVVMQIQVDEGLRARFHTAAARDRRAADQVLDELMRAYVARRAEGSGGCGSLAAGDERDLEALARDQRGWRCCPFGE